MAFLSVLLILGISTPFNVLFTSKMALVFAVLPSVLMAKDCEKALCPEMIHSIAVRNKAYFMVKVFSPKLKRIKSAANTKILVFISKTRLF